MEELVFLSTTQLAAAIRAGHVSATEVLEAHLAQVATRNPVLNAVVTMDDERAYAGELIDMITGAFQRQDEARPITLAHYLEALHIRDQSMLAWEHFFEEWDLLLCPPAMVTAFPHCTPGSPLLLDGRQVSYDLTAAYGTVFNYTGHPAVALPYQRDHDGLPIGIQLVGKRWSESRLRAMAKALTEVTGAFQRPPG